MDFRKAINPFSRIPFKHPFSFPRAFSSFSIPSPLNFLQYLKIPSSTVGIDLTKNLAIAVELQKLNKTTRLSHISSVSLSEFKKSPEENVDTSRVVGKLLQTKRFSTRRIVVAISGGAVIVRFVRFPKMSPSDLASAMVFEAEKYIPFDIQEVVFDHQALGPVDPTTETKGMNVVLVAAKKQAVRDVVEGFRKGGYHVDVVDTAAFALINAFQFAYPEEKEKSVVLLDIGEHSSNISILSLGVPTFTREISFGFEDIIDSIERKLNIQRKEAADLITDPSPSEGVKEVLFSSFESLVAEIETSFSFYMIQNQRIESMDVIYISGIGKKIPLIFDYLSQRLNVKASSWNPCRNLEIDPSVDQKMLEFLFPYLPVSIGLALR